MTEWERCRAWIERAIPYSCGMYTIEDVEEKIKSGDATFWPGDNAAVVTEFWDMPNRKALNFWLAGGDDLDELKQMHYNICEWGKLQGCTLSFIAGRAGWSRALGYKPAWTVMTMELE